MRATCRRTLYRVPLSFADVLDSGLRCLHRSGWWVPRVGPMGSNDAFWFDSQNHYFLHYPPLRVWPVAMGVSALHAFPIHTGWASLPHPTAGCHLSRYCVPARGHQGTEGRGYGSEEL